MSSFTDPPGLRGQPVSGATPPAAPDDGLWVGPRRALTVGLVLTVTLVAFESLAIATVMPEVEDDLGGLALYGWVFSAFFLASILGIVVAGQLADRRGLMLPFAGGLVLFAIGLVVGGMASSMEELVAGRVAQGFGAGAIPASAYVAISRGYPPRLRPRMFAVISTAWVVPGLIGPAIATVVEHLWSWRVVFIGLLPIVFVAGVTAVPALRSLTPGARTGSDGHDERLGLDRSPRAVDSNRHRLRRVVALVLGAGAVLAATSSAPPHLAVPLVALGLPVAGWAFLGLVPAGTIRLAEGAPATVAVRGVLTCGFFATDAYVTLAVVDGRGAATWVGGAALSAASVSWASAAWVQARLIEGVGPRRLVAAGFTILAASLAVLVGVAVGLPVALAIAAWGVGGFGMGLAYSPLSITVLAAAPSGTEGAASASIQLSDTLGMAVGTGLGGSLIAIGDGRGWAVSSSTAWVFGASAIVASLGILAARRLPAQLPSETTSGA